MNNMMFDKPKTKVLELACEGNIGKFQITPLERGFGDTVGNSLRRILLSSIPGTAITTIEIAGASHEFSTVDGIVEDVMTIILNLKGIILSCDSTEPDFETIITIDKDIEGEVLAGDIVKADGVEIVNPDHYIATIAKGGKLNMRLKVRRGNGYVGSIENKQFIQNVGEIAIDSIYTPIKKVSYSVEKTRVGKVADNDELTISIETNGATTSQDALAIAAKMMIEHLNVITELSRKALETDYMSDVAHEDEHTLFDKSIDELDLSVRSYNCLRRAGITTLRELSNRTEDEMINIKNLGRKSYKQIEEKIKEYGLTFKK